MVHLHHGSRAHRARLVSTPSLSSLNLLCNSCNLPDSRSGNAPSLMPWSCSVRVLIAACRTYSTTCNSLIVLSTIRTFCISVFTHLCGSLLTYTELVQNLFTNLHSIEFWRLILPVTMRLFWYYAEQFADVLGSSGYPFHSLFRSIRAILYCRELVSSHDIDSQSSPKGRIGNPCPAPCEP